MKRVSGDEHELALEKPPVLGLHVVRVQPHSVRIVFEVEDVRVAVGVGIVHASIYITVLRVLSGLYLIWHKNAPDACTK